jgi:mRNA interferase RelE/StbE
MVWQINFSIRAEKELKNLDNQTVTRILSYLKERLANISNPRSVGGPLHGVHDVF